MLETDDADVPQTPVDLDFGEEFGSLPRFLESALRDDFGCRDLLSIEVRALVAFGKTTLSQKLPSRVPFNHWFAQSINHLLLNNHILVLLSTRD